jgi:hypothetical protein
MQLSCVHLARIMITAAAVATPDRICPSSSASPDGPSWQSRTMLPAVEFPKTRGTHRTGPCLPSALPWLDPGRRTLTARQLLLVNVWGIQHDRDSRFSWRGFSSRPLAGPSVGDLVTLCSTESPKLFVAHDSLSGWSGVVVPDGVLALVDRLELPYDAPAFDVGLLSALSQGQLVARWNQSASTVARLARWAGATSVIVVSDTGDPQGLFQPTVVAERLPRTFIVQNSSPFVRYVVGRAETDLVEAITALESEHVTFHAESINDHAVDPYICKEGGIDHHVLFCPHDPPHQFGPCGRGEWAT